MRTEWVDCQSPTDFEVWTKAYDQFGDEIPRFFPWEGLTGPQRGILAEIYHVHEKEWYDREVRHQCLRCLPPYQERQDR